MTAPIRLRRLTPGPIITPDLLPGRDGDNINGPSLIEAPSWLPARLGRFYLYFAHHRGRYIRLAWADHLEGPWKVHQPGSLSLSQATGCRDHIASPDVHVDATRRQVRMYFHGPAVDRREELTFVARSSDGIEFQVDPAPVAAFYFKTVPWRQYWIGMSKGGCLYLSDDAGATYRRLRRPVFPMRHPLGNAPGDVRHVALRMDRDQLVVYFSRIGDAPECILQSTVDLSRPVADWQAGDASPVLVPQTEWEGALLPIAPSTSGPSRGREHALRDPDIVDVDGRTYLLYATAGESGIAIAELVRPPPARTAAGPASSAPSPSTDVPITRKSP